MLCMGLTRKEIIATKLSQQNAATAVNASSNQKATRSGRSGLAVSSMYSSLLSLISLFTEY
eukprot:scaffold200143_cov37-Prasinocladus_malaysianus.AAC.1